MPEKVKLLWQLQELDITLRESHIVHGKVHDNEKDVEEISEKVAKLRSEIDANMLSRYDRLIKQGVSVVHVNDGMCMGCYISIPVGDLNRMKSSTTEPACPHCGRFLMLEHIWEEVSGGGNQSSASS